MDITKRGHREMCLDEQDGRRSEKLLERFQSQTWEGISIVSCSSHSNAMKEERGKGIRIGTSASLLCLVGL